MVRDTVSLLFVDGHSIEKTAEAWIRIGTEGISNNAFRSASALYRIDNGHIIGIACSLEPVVLHDCQFISLIDLSGVHVAECLIQEFKVGSEPSLRSSTASAIVV